MKHGHAYHAHDHDAHDRAPRPPDEAHAYAGHGAHGTEVGERRLTVALFILGAFTLIEAAGGYVANSIALLAEAAHMLTVALIGAVANLAAFLTLSGARSLNERSARAHVLSDLLGSGMTSVAALLILVWGLTIADPLLSLLVAALVVRSAWAITREAADVLLESVPAGFDVTRIESELMGHVPGLMGVHHVHVWSMTGEHPTVTLHAHLSPDTPHGQAIAAIHRRLAERLRVEHTTVQIDELDGCENPPCDQTRPA